MFTKKSLAIITTGLVTVLVTMLGLGIVTAQSTLSRSFDNATVAAGGQVVVTITLPNYGGFGKVTENLPTGFTYVDSSLDSFQVDATGGDVITFLLQGDSSFTYTVTASSTPGPARFTGTLRDADRMDRDIPANEVTVEAAAGPTATPTQPAMQNTVTVSRSFDSTTVAASAQVTVTIDASNYGGIARVTETLPAGFTYDSTSLDPSQVTQLGNNQVRFTLQGDTSFTYTVTAPSAARTYTFMGQLVDSNRDTHEIARNSVTVEAAAGPASRSFSPSNPGTGASVTVTITASNYGGFGRLTETLPAGFSYVSSSLPNNQVTELSGNQVRFTLQSDNSFTYEVTAPATANTYTFRGTFSDADRAQTNVGGTSRLQVGGTAPPPVAPTAVPPPPAATAAPPPANQRPTFDGGTVQERSIAEGSEEGANVGDPVSATDANGDEVTYSFLPGSDEGLFEIDSSTGQITVGEGTELDFETKSSYVVRVRASDPLGAADHGTVTINVTDVDEDATPTPEPTTAPEPTSTPAPTATRRPATATPVPTATMPAPTATAVPTATMAPPTATPAPTATPEPEPTMAPPTATTAPTAMPEPTATPEPEPTVAPTPAPTATTAPPAPTATTAPVEPEEEPGFPVVIILLIIVAIVVVAVVIVVVRRR